MKKRVLALGTGAALSLALVACSSNESTDAMESPEPSAMMTEDSMMAVQAFGAGCAAVPETGAGSFDGMAADPVATAASNNPALSTLVSAVTAADLGATLNGAESITVFAPANSAFEAVPEDTLNGLLADPDGALTEVLTYHVVGEQLSPDRLAGTHTTLNGATLTVTGSGEEFMVNDSAAVVCGNVKTANATVYIIDGVLTPAS